MLRWVSVLCGRGGPAASSHVRVPAGGAGVRLSRRGGPGRPGLGASVTSVPPVRAWALRLRVPRQCLAGLPLSLQITFSFNKCPVPAQRATGTAGSVRCLAVLDDLG